MRFLKKTPRLLRQGIRPGTILMPAVALLLMLDTSAGANQLAEPGWYVNQDIPESEWMAQSPPCSDIVTPGDPPEFELCGEPDPEGIGLYLGIDHPTETRGKRLRRGPSCDQLSGHRSHHWRQDYTGPIAKDTIDLDTTPGQTYCYQVHLLDASERVIAVSTTVSVTDT